MEAYIARGGISHVLSQARASLKNPSRPYTPRTNARPLFSGDDYRPESRPSSSYTAAEQMEMERMQVDASPSPAVDSPSASLLPPRIHRLKKSEDTESSSGSASQLKLVHAPPVPFDADNPLDTAEDDYNSEEAAHEKGFFDPEASLSLPSTNELVASYHEIDGCLTALTSSEQPLDSPAFSSEIDCLCRLTERFIDLSTFLLSRSSQHTAQDAAASNPQLCLKLFRRICSAVLNQWNTLPAVVLELTPSLIQLLASTRSANDSTASNQVVQLGKLLFMLSKDSANDRAFCCIRYVEAALDAISSTSVAASSREASEDADILLDPSRVLFPLRTLIYIAGTLKNLSSGGDERMLKLLATHRCIPILSETLRWRCADEGQGGGVAAKEIAQLLVQTTGILRNLSASKSTSKQFLEARISPRLCAVVPDFMEHQELMVNVSRILSKLTLHERPRAQINETPENIGHLVAVVDPRRNAWLSLVDHPPQQQTGESRAQEMLLVRVFFVLGNLCASNDRNRDAVAFRYGGVSVLLAALQCYGRRYTGRSREGLRTTDSDGEDATTSISESQTVEILVKLVRALANMTVNAEVAAALNSKQALAVLPELLRHSLDAGDEELMLNAVSFVTNLSFFHCGQSPRRRQAKEGAVDAAGEADGGFVAQYRLEIAAVLARILLDPNEEAVLEAARTFGNLSRHADVLSWMRQRKVLDCFVLLLDHRSREIVFAVCGVLMNAALDPDARHALMNVPATSEDVEAVRRSGSAGVCGLLTAILVDCAAAEDVEMALMAGKTLFNLLLRSDSEEAARLPVVPVATLRRVVESVMETLEHPVSSFRSKSGRQHGDNEGGQGDDSDGCEPGTEADRKELSALLPQLLRSINCLQ